MKKFYIYNLEQINFYLNYKVCPVEIGVHSKSKNAFAVFYEKDTREVYDLWCKECEKYKTFEKKRENFMVK